jgi:hypothetical protein
MKRLEIPSARNTPHIILDIDSKEFLIEGKSFPEDSREFYNTVIEWLDEFKASKPIGSIKVCFNLFYLSSSSVISVKQILFKFVELNNEGATVVIEWSYDEDDDDIKKTGEEYQKITKLNFEYKINH